MVVSDEIKGIYEYKKKSCEERMISWEFTLEEFATLWMLRNTLKCAYSNRIFNLEDKSSEDYPTLERIDDLKSYNRHNVILTTAKNNKLKDRYIDKGESLPKNDPETASYVHRIKKALNSVESIEKMLSPYVEAYSKLYEELAKEEVSCKKKSFSEERKKVSEDKILTEMYLEYYKGLQKMDVELLVGFTDFKKLITLKRCQVTKENLPKDLMQRTLWVCDKSKEVTSENVLVCSKDLCLGLDYLQSKGLTSLGQLATLGKGLVNLVEGE